MFQKLGEFVTRWWLALLLLWLAAVIGFSLFAPKLADVVKTGEFAFLPPSSPSLVSERLFAQAFPGGSERSSIVIVVRRVGDHGKSTLTDRDLDFIDSGGEGPDQPFELKNRLLQLVEQNGGLALSAETEEEEGSQTGGDPAEESAPAEATEDSAVQDGGSASKAPVAAAPKPGAPVKPRSTVTAVRTFRDPKIGRLLRSEDGQAALVMVELTTEFMDANNRFAVEAVENLLFHDTEFRRHIPPGLDLSLSGAAVVGRDMLKAAKDSAHATELLTVVLVVVLLVIIYRAPLLALIPLVTVVVAVKLSMTLLILLAERQLVTMFQGVESYVTVLLYGAGVDYCLFLIARYKEELDAGVSFEDAVASSLGKVGAAITASAGTVICGIGMMIFAEFGKFHEAGIAITFGLVIVLLASLTFTPTLLRLTGRWAFWPQMRSERPSAAGGWIPVASPTRMISEKLGLRNFWDYVGKVVLRRPGTVWLASVVLMLPWAVVGVMFYRHLSYGLLSDLPANSPSVAGTKALQEHFASGTTGPVTILLHNPNADFTAWGGERAGINAIDEFTKNLSAHREELFLADVRSVSHPFGGDESLESIRNIARRRITTDRSVNFYVSRKGEYASTVTRLDLTAELDPFSRDSIQHLGELEKKLPDYLPESLKNGTKIYLLGTTASIRDLKSVTDRDQVRIDLLVIVGVFFILVVLLRQAAVSAYLIVTVLFSYLVTLGFTYTFFSLTEPNFAGLDWKVPMFLFTILIAVGEDYNIFLMTRIEEEQDEYGPVQGIIHALSKTGRIISSCGIIMAGTFASLTGGYLKGMIQLGFALACGVLLDTFVIRTVLVPAYLVMLHGGRFGRLGKYLGAREEGKPHPESPLANHDHHHAAHPHPQETPQ